MGRKRGSAEIKYDCSICIGSGVSQDVMTADLDQLPRIEPEKWRTCYHKILTVMTIIKWKSDFESGVVKLGKIRSTIACENLGQKKPEC